MDLFEKFDQIEVRFTKLFAGLVFCLVAALIVVDIVGAALRDTPPPPASSSIKKVPNKPECQIRPDGTLICDAVPPQQPK